jgi:two-component system response regulator GlrR
LANRPGRAQSFRVEPAKSRSQRRHAACFARGMAEGRILVVDDDSCACDALSTLLGDEGFHVESARDGVDACRKLESFRPCVVVSDLEMPRMDGFELLDRIRQDFPSVPVIVMSTLGTGAPERVRRQGAADFVAKPIELPTLLEKVQDVMRDAQA